MEFTLRAIQFILKIIYFFINTMSLFIWRRKNDSKRIPPIRNRILILTLHQAIEKLQRKQLTSQELISAYIKRLREVNKHLNAIVEERYRYALDEAKAVDNMIAIRGPEEIKQLYKKKPLLGVPFTVKEACGVKGMSFVVGSQIRWRDRSPNDGRVVRLLREAGAIPLLISTNPEFCLGIETSSSTSGGTLNPYDSEHAAGGSSGGEGALNAAGASLFGIGSDMDGSIRIPCLFNGVFGHKPTGGVTSISGHFPSCDDPNCAQILQLGPITRFASDMRLILSVIAEKNVHQLKLDSPIDIKRIKIYYSFGFTGFNALLHETVQQDVEVAINDAVHFFEELGLRTQPIEFKGLRNSLEIAHSAIPRIQNYPHMFNTTKETFFHFIQSSLFGSDYTKEALWFDVLSRTNAFMSRESLRKYKTKTNSLKIEIIKVLGTNGVLFFPTFPMPSFLHGTSLALSLNIDYTMLFNVLGLPATHVTMGLTKDGLPVGFQVIAAPYNDILCLKIAEELDTGFGGWVPPSNNAF